MESNELATTKNVDTSELQAESHQEHSATVPPQYHEVPPPYTISVAEPIITQPHSGHQNAVLPGGWMPMPPPSDVPGTMPTPMPMAPPQVPPPNRPRGLEYLSMVDQLLVHQQIELLEVLTGFETQNKYKIKNTLGQMVYFAVEDSDFCMRNCCGPLRPFEMKIFDNYKQEVLHFYRPLNCQCWCCPCCLQSIEVAVVPGNVVGSVQQEWSIFWPTFAVKNANGDTMYRIEGPFIKCSCGSDVNFKITTADGSQEIGKITKQWGGFVREAYTDADNFSISFPLDLDVNMKAVLLSGLFLIDMMFYETNANNDRRRRY